MQELNCISLDAPITDFGAQIIMPTTISLKNNEKKIFSLP